MVTITEGLGTNGWWAEFINFTDYRHRDFDIKQQQKHLALKYKLPNCLIIYEAQK